MRDVLHVDAAGSHIGGHKDIDRAVAKLLQRPFASVLPEVTVNRAGLEAALLQILGEFLRGPLGLAEDHGALATVCLQYPGDEFGLVHGMGAPHMLLDRLDGGHLITGVGGADVGRLGHVATCQAQDLPRHGGREEHGLAHRRDPGHQLLHVGQESHVEHLVGFIEHEGLDARQVQDALIGQIDEPPGRADDDVDALLELLDLRLVGLTAVDRQYPGVGRAARVVDVIGDLQAQFPGGDDDQGLWCGAFTVEAL